MKTICLSVLLAAVSMTPGTPHAPLQKEACLSCHAASDVARIEPRLTRPCASMCLSCHTRLEGHHPIGVPIDKKVSAPLLLTADGKNTCSTCHDLTVSATARAPWTSQSLVSWIARRPKNHRTYHLVLRNDRGQLCRNCH